MRTWLTCLLMLLPPLAVAVPAAIPEPVELEPDVRFWMRVYSEISTNEGFIHDQRNLAIVYETLHFDPARPPRAREQQVDQAREHWHNILRRLELHGLGDRSRERGRQRRQQH